MRERNDSVSPEKLSELMVLGMQEKKASDIVVLDLRKVKNAVADFFIICISIYLDITGTIAAISAANKK